ncbi:MAG: hypothetical protein ACOCZQ_00785 [Nanoarchaeota archaeon]
MDKKVKYAIPIVIVLLIVVLIAFFLYLSSGLVPYEKMKECSSSSQCELVGCGCYPEDAVNKIYEMSWRNKNNCSDGFGKIDTICPTVEPNAEAICENNKCSIKVKADNENQLILSKPEPLTIKNEDQIFVGFFNALSSTAQNVQISINKCLNKNKEIINTNPKIESKAKDIPPKKSGTFKINITLPESGYNPGSYVCQFIAYNAKAPANDDITNPEEGGFIYEKKSFFLEVT